MLKKLGLDAPTNEIPETSFAFNGLHNSEILDKTVEYDDMARELYIQFLEKTNPKVISFLIDGNDVAIFNAQLKQMIEDETRHIGMVKTMVSKIHRIQ
jgi:hypothetical protein